MTATRTFAIGTRASALALWQTERVRERLAGAGYPTNRIEIRTTGDLIQNVPLSGIGSRALFTRQIDDAMLEGRIDLAVHSLKDLPTVLPPGIALAAVSEREDPRDALVSRDGARWASLPEGSVVATSSLRRRAQLLHLRPDLHVADIRGNVDTRLAKLGARAEWAGIILAAAGLVRLGQAHRISERLDPEIMLPAPGQGALAVTARADDAAALAAARGAIHDPATASAVAAERAFLRRLEGGCQVPVAAYAEPSGNGEATLRLRGRVVSLLGERAAEGAVVGPVRDEAEAEAIGLGLAERLLGEGADEILASVRAAGAPPIAEP
ncbi:MAG TPA: hydroxymethylbilane synthase [Gemmatimonadales bacterium]|nr:hydroxymethylbilane synthase [Gemmatimonadales bacterium]